LLALALCRSPAQRHMMTVELRLQIEDELASVKHSK